MITIQECVYTHAHTQIYIVATRPKECLCHSGKYHTPMSVQSHKQEAFIQGTTEKTRGSVPNAGKTRNNTDGSVSHERVNAIVPASVGEKVR